MGNTFKIIELVLAEDEGFDGVNAISIVESPAMESEFMLFSKDAEMKFKAVDKEKRIVMGALLIPNKMILRNFEDGYAYVYFSPETIRKSSELFFKNGFQNNATVEHMINVDDLTLVESWIIEDTIHDKSRKYGMEYPVGTWMGSMLVKNDVVWEEVVKSGVVKGFSIEGFYQRSDVKLNQEDINSSAVLKEIVDILKSIDENTTE